MRAKLYRWFIPSKSTRKKEKYSELNEYDDLRRPPGSSSMLCVLDAYLIDYISSSRPVRFTLKHSSYTLITPQHSLSTLFSP